MAEPITLSGHQPVTWLRVYLEESRLLIRRYWWLLLGFIHIRNGIVEWQLDLNHAYIWPIFLHPVKLFMLYTAASWAMLIWGGNSPDRRSVFWTMPVSRLTHHSARIIPGAILLVITYLVTWYSGVIICSIFGEVRGLIAGFLPSLGFFALGISFLNLYLLSSLICLRFQQPYRWLFMYCPLTILGLWGVQMLLDIHLIRLLFSPLLPPNGVLGGLGIAIWDKMGGVVEPVIWAPFLWFGIISVSLLFTASRHQEA